MEWSKQAEYSQTTKLIIELYKRIEQILAHLRPAFSREATFEWFVLLIWGVILNSQAAAVTSYLNAIGLGQRHYQQALHWFHSSGFKLEQLCKEWGNWLKSHPNSHRLRGAAGLCGGWNKGGQRRASDAGG